MAGQVVWQSVPAGGRQKTCLYLPCVLLLLVHSKQHIESVPLSGFRFVVGLIGASDFMPSTVLQLPSMLKQPDC